MGEDFTGPRDKATIIILLNEDYVISYYKFMSL